MRKRGFTEVGKILCRSGMWLEEMKKRDEKEKMEEMHQHKVAPLMKSAERGGAQILKKEEEDARFLDRCESKMKLWAKH